jgi:colicin import membrane protein
MRMTRKLKTYQTSLGFYDFAIAAPSMKAALEAWGAGSNLFHQGVAKESSDPEVVAATMSKPGVVLRRPVGSDTPFSEHPDLPTRLVDDEPGHRPKKTAARRKERVPPKTDEAASKAIIAFEKEQRRRENQRRKEETARKKQRERRDRAIAKAKAALKKAGREHDDRVAKIKAGRDAVERKSQAESARWAKQKDKLETDLRRASE